MATTIESPIKEKDSYYVIRHKLTRLYVHGLDSNIYNLEEIGPLDSVDDQSLGPLRISPRHLDKQARRVIDCLNQNDHFVAWVDPERDFEYSDFELLLVEVEYSVKDTQPVAAIV
jgi:hypothetical protein